MATTTDDPGTPGLRISVNGRVAEVVIDRPPANALARSTYRELKVAFDGFRERDDISAVILKIGRAHV